MKDTKINKDLKILLLKSLKEGVFTAERKQELCEHLEIKQIQIEIIDKTEDVEDYLK